MRLLPSLLLALIATLSLRADDDVPVTITPIAGQTIALGGAAVTIDLNTYFTLPGVTGQLVRIETTEGIIFAELLSSAAPKTVTNFLSYITDGSYDNSIIHRSVPGFVIQGGGFHVDAQGHLPAITAKTAVANEYKHSNTRGTLAMAKLGGNPDSATDEWFINLADNSGNLDAQNGGFTVFARVLGNGMAVADAIAALPTYDLTNINAAFDAIPLAGVLPGQGTLYIANLVGVTSVKASTQAYAAGQAGSLILDYRALNSNSAVVTATLNGGILTLKPGKSAGSAVITIRDINGNFADSTFAVTINAPVKATPVSQFAQTGQPATFAITPTNGATYQWQRKPAGSKVWSSLPATTPYTGPTTATLTVDPTTAAMSGDQFQCLVTVGGKTTIRGVGTLSVIPAPPASVPSQKTYATGSVPLDLSGGSPNGLTYYATKLPAGLMIDAATGHITGTLTAKPGTYVVQYWSQNGKLKSAIQTITFVISAFPTPMVAAYEGLLVDGDGIPVGKVELNVTSTGAFTGKLTCTEAKSYSLRGQLALNADYSAAVVTLTLPRASAPSSPFSLGLSVFNNSSLSATLSANATTVGTLLQTDSATVPPATATGASWLGNYTLVLGDPQNLDSSPLDAAVTPAGIGYATLSIPTSGLMTLKGKTADGTPFTAALTTSYSATYRAYIKPYKSGGYLAGWLDMTTRDPNKNGQTWALRLDGASIKTFDPGPSAATYADYTATFTATATSHILSFVGLNAHGGDNAVLLDNVRVTAPDIAAATVANFSFETPTQSSGAYAYQYNPASAGWTFSAASGLNGSGISTNYTLITYGNTTAPNGSQVAFLQGTGTITQTLTGLTIGKLYTVTFSAAQRANILYNVVSATNSDFYWAKAPSSTDKTYPLGFGPVGLNVSVEPWRNFVFLTSSSFPLSVSQAGVSNAGGNSDQLPINLALDASYTASLAAPSDLANPSHWTMKINTTTGSFAGTFTLPRTVNGKATTLKVPFEGVLQQQAAPVSSGTSFGQGFFLLPSSDGAGSTIRSGRIQFSTP